MDFRFDIVAEYGAFFLQGTLLTVGLSLIGVFLGTIIGLFISLGKMMKSKWCSLIFTCYINIIRGTPLLVQLLIIHFGIIPLFLHRSNGIAATIVALSINASAYIAETIRAGIQSIHKGQMEAARSLGMTYMQAMRYVILPQAMKRMLPPLGNEFISLIKDSSLASTIAAPELMYWAQAMNAQYYRVWESYLTSAAVYLFLTFTLTQLLGRLERRLNIE